MFSVYVHIPFCLKKCGYCDFHSIACSEGDVPRDEYASAVCAELKEVVARHGLRGRKVDTIYFGGGTPTLLETRNLERVLNSIHECFSVSPSAEISIEANPETLKTWNAERGTWNRLSIGIQSFNDAQLKKLGRIHATSTAIDAVKRAQEAGFKNISIDLMWGLPEQTMKELGQDLDMALALGVQHISAYQLTIEDEKNGLKTLDDEDLSREMFILVHDKLTGGGFGHYEISNFARPGFECRHNLNYWHSGEWLGLGSGATSSLVEPETRNVKRETCSTDIKKYLERSFNYDTETVNVRSQMAEHCFMALRTSDGIDLKDFKDRFGVEFNVQLPDIIEQFVSRGLAEKKDGRFALTLDGWLISNELFQEFI